VVQFKQFAFVNNTRQKAHLRDVQQPIISAASVMPKNVVVILFIFTFEKNIGYIALHKRLLKVG